MKERIEKALLAGIVACPYLAIEELLTMTADRCGIKGGIEEVLSILRGEEVPCSG